VPAVGHGHHASNGRGALAVKHARQAGSTGRAALGAKGGLYYCAQGTAIDGLLARRRYKPLTLADPPFDPLASELPGAEPATAARRIPWRCKAPGIPSQYGLHARQKLANAERRRDAVIGAELEPDHPIDLVASLIGDDDHRDIGARPDVAQQVEPVVLAETQFEDRQVWLALGEMAHHCLASRRAQSAHLVSLEIVHDHLPRDGVVNCDEDERR
jgi:hypothetical protein